MTEFDRNKQPARIIHKDAMRMARQTMVRVYYPDMTSNKAYLHDPVLYYIVRHIITERLKKERGYVDARPETNRKLNPERTYRRWHG